MTRICMLLCFWPTVLAPAVASFAARRAAARVRARHVCLFDNIPNTAARLSDKLSNSIPERTPGNGRSASSRKVSR